MREEDLTGLLQLAAWSETAARLPRHLACDTLRVETTQGVRLTKNAAVVHANPRVAATWQENRRDAYSTLEHDRSKVARLRYPWALFSILAPHKRKNAKREQGKDCLVNFGRGNTGASLFSSG